MFSPNRILVLDPLRPLSILGLAFNGENFRLENLRAAEIVNLQFGS